MHNHTTIDMVMLSRNMVIKKKKWFDMDIKYGD